VVDRIRLTKRAEKGVHSRQHGERERRGGQVCDRRDPQAPHEQEHGRKQQQHVQPPIGERVMALRQVEYGFNLREAHRPEITRLHGETATKRLRGRRRVLRLQDEPGAVGNLDRDLEQVVGERNGQYQPEQIRAEADAACVQ
jgi:hypothetical protein